MRNTPALARFWGLLLFLVALHFAVRPRLGDPRLAPDFVLVALLFFAVRTRPGAGAAAGFLVGLMTDALAPTAFGSAALACTVVGYGAGWLTTLTFADNLLINALFVFAASWLRDAVQVLAANQLASGALAWQLLAWSPLSGLSTAAAAFAVLLVFRGWLAARPA